MGKLTQKEFIERVTKNHPHLDFSEYIFTETRGYSIVKDSLGIKYLTKAQNLLRGKNLNPTSESAIDKQDWFLTKARQVHGNYYDYSKVKYVNVTTKVCIICPIHGEFYVRPTGHLKGNKCKKCSFPKHINHPGGYSGKYKHDPNYELYLYTIKLYNENETFYKVGLSNDPTRRFTFFPYKVDVIRLKKGILGDLFPKEQKIINNLKHYAYIPKIHFKGYSECFSKIE